MPTLRVLSLGAGVQSSTLYLMAVHGEFGADIPSVAIFADTQWEPADVYSWLDELERIGGALIPIQRVTRGNIRTTALDPSTRFASMPLYAITPRSLRIIPEYETFDSETGEVVEHGAEEMEVGGEHGMLRRQCTREFKIEPITKAIRERLGVKRGFPVPKSITVERWMGISTDEATRMRDSHEKWAKNRYPLIEKRMSRHDCLVWLEKHGYAAPPKSACIGCPYTDSTRWREMKANRPDEFADAVDFDHAIRKGVRGVTQDAYLHRSLKPLDEVDFRSDEDLGQLNAFENECTGFCER